MPPHVNNLFRSDRGQMTFDVNLCTDRDELRQYIECGGGIVDDDGNGPFTITLVDPGSKQDLPNKDTFGSHFILKCCLKNEILNLRRFWIHRSQQYSEDFDPHNILVKEYPWDFAKKHFSRTRMPIRNIPNLKGLIVIGELVPAVVLEDIQDLVKKQNTDCHTDTDSLNLNCRNEFTQAERIAIVKYINKYNAFNELKSTSLWENMENELSRHTWQSLKEHFKKVIMPNISEYELSKEAVAKCRSVMKASQSVKRRKKSYNGHSSKASKQKLSGYPQRSWSGTKRLSYGAESVHSDSSDSSIHFTKYSTESRIKRTLASKTMEDNVLETSDEVGEEVVCADITSCSNGENSDDSVCQHKDNVRLKADNSNDSTISEVSSHPPLQKLSRFEKTVHNAPSITFHTDIKAQNTTSSLVVENQTSDSESDSQLDDTSWNDDECNVEFDSYPPLRLSPSNDRAGGVLISCSNFGCNSKATIGVQWDSEVHQKFDAGIQTESVNVQFFDSSSTLSPKMVSKFVQTDCFPESPVISSGTLDTDVEVMESESSSELYLLSNKKAPSCNNSSNRTLRSSPRRPIIVRNDQSSQSKLSPDKQIKKLRKSAEDSSSVLTRSKASKTPMQSRAKTRLKL